MPVLLRSTIRTCVLGKRLPLAFILLLLGTLNGCQMHLPRSQDEGLSKNVEAPLSSDDDWAEAEEQAPDDIWQRMRQGFALQDAIGINPRIEQQRLWFVSNPSFLQNACDRGSLYIHYVVEQLEQRDMPLELALLPVIESAYNPMAYSRSHAVGIWQFIPATGRNFNLTQSAWYDGRRDILASTHAAISYLTRLQEMFNGDWLLALAAYNAGEGTVSRAIERNQKLGLPTDYWNLPLPQETRDYVPKLLALSQIVMSPEAYGVDLYPIANEPYFEVVALKEDRIDLGRLASMAQMDKDEMLQLNPAFKRGITYGGPKRLLVPSEKAEQLQASLAQIKPQDPLDWHSYTVRSGDSLQRIANRYQVTVNLIKEINNLSSHRLKVGQNLSIPSEPGLKFDPPKTQQARASSQHYKVKEGDSLWSIAKAQQVKVDDLKRWNQLKDHQLKQGQLLTLKAKAPQTAANQRSSKTVTTVRQSVTYYKIRPGDSLQLIANKHKVKLEAVMRWNPKLNSKNLKPGQSVALYLP